MSEKIFRNRNLLVLDMLLMVLAYGVTICMLYNTDLFLSIFYKDISFIATTVIVYIFCFLIAGIYRILWVHAGTKDYLRFLIACAVGSFFVSGFGLLIRPEGLVFKEIILMECSVTIFVISARMGIRVLNRMLHIYSHSADKQQSKKRLLVIGAGSAASTVLKDATSNENLNYEIVGLIDDNPRKRHAMLNGARVLGNRSDIPLICDRYEINEILFAIPSASSKERRKILEICSETNCKVKILPSIDQILVSKNNLLKRARNVEIEDLLARDPIVLDNKEIAHYIERKVVLVTGGGGSIGSELCRQIMKFNPKTLVIVDIYENNAYDLQNELRRNYPGKDVVVLIASIRDRERIRDIFLKYSPEIVFHAAAHKHVPLMEDSPGEALKNNVFGTYHVAQCAAEAGVKRFVMISTDKAVNPTNVMGATKRICEMIIQCMQQVSKTEFVAVRFGNVLGSNGSVIPLFKKQIEEGGPVTVTHKEITRFFMTIPEAAQLVLQAASYAKGGEIFVLDMGQPVKIYDLALNLIRLAGYRPNIDIKIKITGLRPGEKLYEELFMEEEDLQRTAHSKIFIGKPMFADMNALKKDLLLLHEAVESNNNEQIKAAIAQVVPTYVYKNQVKKAENACESA